MIKKKLMTHGLREKIRKYKKSKIDIADLLKDVLITGEDLSFAYISELNIANEDISNCDFSNSTIKLIANKAKIKNSKFVRTQFVPGSSLRGADCRRSNFFKANLGHIDYSYSDLRGCNMCGTIISFSSRLGYKCKISENVIDLFQKWWDIIPGDPMIDIKVED